MAKQFDQLSEKLIDFIGNQHIYFVGTAGAAGRVNVSPKGMDSLRVLGPNEVIWLNLTGSGNESSAHVQENGRMTIMFCSFEKNPMILRLYGEAEVYHPLADHWSELYSHFPDLAGARQIFRLQIDLVQTSCGFAVPFMSFEAERDTLIKYAENKGPEGMQDYWREKNTETIDGYPTHIVPLGLGD